VGEGRERGEINRNVENFWMVLLVCLKPVKYNTNRLKKWSSQNQLRKIKNLNSKLEDFRKHIVGLDKKVLFLDNPSKRYVNTKYMGLTLSRRYCIIDGKAGPKDDYGETHLS
jgi:hypothetical protein